MAHCKHCNRFVLIKRNSGYCKGCEDYLKAEAIKQKAMEAERLRLAEEERLRREAEEARRLEEERRLAEEERLRREAEEARRLEEERRLAEEERLRREAEEARRLEEERRLAEEERLRREAEEARRLEEERRLAEEERLRREAEEARRLEEERRLAEEERLRREAEEARRLEEERLRREAEEARRLEEERLRREAEEARRLEEERRLAEEERLRREAEEAQNKQQANQLALLHRMWDPQEYLRERVEAQLIEIMKRQEDLQIVSRKGYTAIRRKLWDSTRNWQYIAKVYYRPNALVVSVSNHAPEMKIVWTMLETGFVSADRPPHTADESEPWLDLFVEVEQADKFFQLLLQEAPHAPASPTTAEAGTIDCPAECKDIVIEKLDLSQRAYNRLKRHGIHTLGALCALTEAQLQTFEQTGIVTIGEILHRRAEYVAQYTGVSYAQQPEITPIDDSAGSQIELSSEQGRDIPLEQLNLSVRSYNGLQQAGIRTLGDLCERSEDELLSFKNLGKTSVKEILQRRKEWVARLALPDLLIEADAGNPQAKCPEKGINLPLNRLGLSVRAYNGLTRSGITTFGELFTLTENELAEIKNLGALSVKEILQTRKAWTKRLLSDEVSFDDNDDSDMLQQAAPPVRSFFEYVQGLSNERLKTVVLQRAHGKIFEEIAEQQKVTRSRIQQIENRFWLRAAWGAEEFTESQYIPLIEKYDISEKEFRVIFDESREAWYAASRLSHRSGEALLPLDAACTDESIAEELRDAIQAFCQSIDEAAYIEIDGTKVPAVRSDIERYVLAHYCRDEMLIDDFIDKYNEVLTAAGYQEEHLLITDAVRQTRYNAIWDYEDVLCSFKRRIRYYPIHEYDIPALVDALHLDSYQDIEISARKLLIDYPALMEAYDIRNEYELHNLLRKQNVDQRIEGMVLGKMPTIRFGDTDRASFILNALFDLAPISRDAFTAAISEITGERPEFVLSKAEYWDAINVYLHNDMLTVDSEEMPDHEKQALLASLHDDCYTLPEIEAIYKRATGNSDSRLLSPYNLKKLGFKVFSGYVIRNHPSARHYFKELLTGREIVDYSLYSERFALIGEWTCTLNLLKDRFEIIEFEPYQLVRFDRLAKFGVTIDSLHAFCNEVYQFTDPGQYFTIYSLRRNGFTSPLFNLGFEDWFYSSILREDQRFESIRVGASEAPSLIFCRTDVKVSRQSFIEYLLDGGSMDRDDLLSLIHDDYGVVIDKSDIFHIITDTDMYYDPTMGKLYADKELYYDEV